MEISEGITIVDLGLKIQDTLIIADVHMGFEETLGKQGVLIPALQFKDIVRRLEPILKKTKPKTVIINGDLKHEFGMIMDSEWRNTIDLLDLISKYCDKIILISGNHDTFLGPIAKNKNIEIRDSYTLGGIYICHGHELHEGQEFKRAKTLVVGHEHPAVALREGSRSEKYKCFLKGKYQGKDLIVMPSFNLMTLGLDILQEQILSPFLKQNLDDFEVFIVGDKVYPRVRIKDIF